MMNNLKQLLVREIPIAVETMSSLQIVRLINMKRELDGNEIILHHRSFMAKVPKVLGKEDAKNFLHIYLDTYSRETPCYSFPRREAMLMMMSYDYDLQSAVYDRMIELEQQLKNTYQLPDFNNPIAAAEAWIVLQKDKLVLQNENNKLTESNQTLENLFTEGMTVPQFCKQLNGVNVQQVNRFIYGQGWLFLRNTNWFVSSKARDVFMTERMVEIKILDTVRVVPRQQLLRKGAVELFRWYMEDKLPMKQTWNKDKKHKLLS